MTFEDEIQARMPIISGDTFTIEPIGAPRLPGYAIRFTYPPLPELGAFGRPLSLYEMECLYQMFGLWKRAMRELMPGGFPDIICLCGSTRFAAAFRDANYRETVAGKIVLSIGCEWHSDQALGLNDNDKARLDELHLRKIDLADNVLILNVGGYIGESTQREEVYARSQGKTIRYLEPISATS